MMRLYEIAAEYQAATEALADMDLDQQTVEDTLAAVQGEFDAKAKAVAAVILEMEAEADTLATVSKRLADRATSRKRRAEWLRGYLLDQLRQIGKTRIMDTVLPITIMPNPPAVTILSPDSVPDDYVRIKTIREPDKKAIKALLDSGERVNWATLQRGERVKIG